MKPKPLIRIRSLSMERVEKYFVNGAVPGTATGHCGLPFVPEISDTLVDAFRNIVPGNPGIDASKIEIMDPQHYAIHRGKKKQVLDFRGQGHYLARLVRWETQDCKTPTAVMMKKFYHHKATLWHTVYFMGFEVLLSGMSEDALSQSLHVGQYA